MIVGDRHHDHLLGAVLAASTSTALRGPSPGEPMIPRRPGARPARWSVELALPRAGTRSPSRATAPRSAARGAAAASSSGCSSPGAGPRSSVGAHSTHAATAVRGACAPCSAAKRSRYRAAISAPAGLMKSANAYGSPSSPAQIALWGEEPSSHGSGSSGGRAASRRAGGTDGRRANRHRGRRAARPAAGGSRRETPAGGRAGAQTWSVGRCRRRVRGRGRSARGRARRGS